MIVYICDEKYTCRRLVYICDQKYFNFTKYVQIFVYHNSYKDDRLVYCGLFQHENALIL